MTGPLLSILIRIAIIGQSQLNTKTRTKRLKITSTIRLIILLWIWSCGDEILKIITSSRSPFIWLALRGNSALNNSFLGVFNEIWSIPSDVREVFLWSDDIMIF